MYEDYGNVTHSAVRGMRTRKVQTSIKDRHFVSNGVRLHYVEYPSPNPPLVVLPGITMPAACMDFVGRRLSLHHHVYILDNRGRGLSESGRHLGYRLDDHARDALGLIAHLHLGQPAILGHSMGARIAIRLAATAPANTGPLVLVDPPVTGPGRRPYPTPLKQFLDAIDSTSRGIGEEAMKQALGWQDEHVELRMKWLPTCSKHAVTEAHRSFHEEDIHKDMPRIASDALLVYAGRGNTVSDAEADEICKLIPHCEKRLISHTSHMIPWDDLETFASAVEQFLTRQSSHHWVANCLLSGSLLVP